METLNCEASNEYSIFWTITLYFYNIVVIFTTALTDDCHETAVFAQKIASKLHGRQQHEQTTTKTTNGKKSPNQQTVMGNRRCLKVLSVTKLILND